MSFFVRPLIPLFLASGDVCSGFIQFGKNVLLLNYISSSLSSREPKINVDESHLVIFIFKIVRHSILNISQICST